MEICSLTLYAIIAVISLLLYLYKRTMSYWKIRGIPHTEPEFFYGNTKELWKTKNFDGIFRKIYHKFKGTGPFAGFYMMLKPMAIVLDLELVKNILIKDFSSFDDRGMFHNEQDDPLTSNLFTLDAGKWRRLRAKISPTFTSAKMKFMYPTIISNGKELMNVMDEIIAMDPVIEIKDILERFTTDVIGTCAFGIDCNSLRDPSAEFRIIGRKVLTNFRHNNLIMGLMQCFPNAAAKLRFRAVTDEVHDFYCNLVKKTVKHREQNNVKRNDFMNLLIEMKNNKLIKSENGEEFEALKMNEVIAQAFVFFLAGLETSATTMSFCLCELAHQQDIQDKVRKEVMEVFEKHNGECTYECMKELTYLNQVIRGLFRGNIVAIKKIYKKSVDITRTIRKELKQMREIRHENIIGFIGASIDHGTVAILTTYCARGSLEDVLANEDLHLDHMFISSLVSDILKGMIYLHDSDIISHGNLRSSNCLIDSRWVCQISDFGLHEFKAGQEEPNKREMELKRALWTAPELLRDLGRLPRGSQKGDVYSFGIVLYEIIGRKGPWGDTAYSSEEIIERVKNAEMYRHGVFRPPIAYLDVPEYVRQCLRSCWEEDPEVRPDIRLVRIKLKELQAGLKSNIFDNMLAIMEKYAYNLEALVQERTNLLYEEKKKTDLLLNQMLPRSVAESLKRGEPVEAECFDCVTILFSDLVGFTELCVKSTPFEVVEMLNDLYTCCDSIISNYDVYKVETIGDAYMVVSGLPIRNGNKHVGEIASLALHLLEQVTKLEIRHRPGESLQFRIGIHSGQCAAGVVGLKMPRYCLFGDTVNTASRMESSGEALKVHISEKTYQLLEHVGGFHCVERGITNVKGKGEMRTYWLIGQIKSCEPGPPFRNSDITPDLISNVDSDSLGPLRLSNDCNSSSLSSVQLQLGNHRISVPIRPNSARMIYPKTYCACRTKCIFNRNSDDNVNFDIDRNPSIDKQSRHLDRNFLCVCNLSSNFSDGGPRGPRSAPHITFRQ